MKLELILLISITIPVLYFDIRYKKIPNWITLGGWIFCLLVFTITHRTLPLSYLLYSAVAFSSYLLLYFISGRRLGLGDVKLALPLGGVSGIFGWYFTNLYASALGLLFFVFMYFFGRYDRNAKIPFGPFLCAGSILYQCI